MIAMLVFVAIIVQDFVSGAIKGFGPKRPTFKVTVNRGM